MRTKLILMTTTIVAISTLFSYGAPTPTNSPKVSPREIVKERVIREERLAGKTEGYRFVVDETKLPKNINIIRAGDLPVNEVEQMPQASWTKPAFYVDFSTGKGVKKSASEIFGKSVTVTKEQMLKKDTWLFADGFVLKNFREVGKAFDKSPIYAVDIAFLRVEPNVDGTRRENSTMKYYPMMRVKNKPSLEISNRANPKNLPVFESNELLTYDNKPLGEVGKWYTVVLGNTLKKWDKTNAPLGVGAEGSAQVEQWLFRSEPFLEKQGHNRIFTDGRNTVTQVVVQINK